MGAGNGCGWSNGKNDTNIDRFKVSALTFSLAIKQLNYTLLLNIDKMFFQYKGIPCIVDVPKYLILGGVITLIMTISKIITVMGPFKCDYR